MGKGGAFYTHSLREETVTINTKQIATNGLWQKTSENVHFKIAQGKMSYKEKKLSYLYKEFK